MIQKNHNLKIIITLTAIVTAILSSCARFGETSITKPTSSSSYASCTTSGAGNCVITQPTVAQLEPNLTPANIMAGITIFGITGTAASGGPTTALTSNIHRDKGAIPWSLVKETVTDRGQAYPNTGTIRAIPSILKDDDGNAGTSVTYVDRTGWGSNTCGTTGAIETRITNCASVFNGTLTGCTDMVSTNATDCTNNSAIWRAGSTATWDGAVNGNAGQSTWKLVTRTADTDLSGRGREVWRDERTGLLWSSLVSGSAERMVDKANGGSFRGTTVDDNKTINWCKASGSNNIVGNPAAEDDPNNYCDNATYQNTTGDAISACYEGAGFTNTDTISNGIDGAGKAGLHSPAVSWRLPTKYDYQQADNDGIRFVMPEMGPNGSWSEWSASVVSEMCDMMHGFSIQAMATSATTVGTSGMVSGVSGARRGFFY